MLSQVEQAATSEQKQGVIEEFLAGQKTLPILKGTIAHFSRRLRFRIFQ